MRRQIYLAAVVLSLLTTIQSRAGVIVEENGTLTTDLPGVTITPTAPQFGGSEAWLVSVDRSVWSHIGIPGNLSDEPGTENHLFTTPAGFIWESEVPFPGQSNPSGITGDWFTASGQPVSVTFEDINDTPSGGGGVPDGGSSLAMLGIAVVGCAGVRKRFVR
jgi:hypothetical protein